MLIIALFLLGLSGCGYKADPFYNDGSHLGDDNVEFKERKPLDNSEAAECNKEK